jgi:hypothetical protein
MKMGPGIVISHLSSAVFLTAPPSVSNGRPQVPEVASMALLGGGHIFIAWTKLKVEIPYLKGPYMMLISREIAQLSVHNFSYEKIWR